jgi:sortase A
VTDFSPEQPAPLRRDFRASKRRYRILGVSGEVLITLGVMVGLFWVWFVFINDTIAGASQRDAGSELAESFQGEATEVSLVKARASSSGRIETGEPPVLAKVQAGQAFATLYVPRFGADYVRPIAEGVDVPTVLNNQRLGVGRYPETQNLGEVGNFAIAAHRTTYGAPFADIAELRVGDRIFVETREGWFAYRFRNHEYVWPTALSVLNKVPRFTSLEPAERILTMTSCHPRFSEAERVIAYAVFDDWYPREGGPPSEIAHLVGVNS